MKKKKKGIELPETDVERRGLRRYQRMKMIRSQRSNSRSVFEKTMN